MFKINIKILQFLREGDDDELFKDVLERLFQWRKWFDNEQRTGRFV